MTRIGIERLIPVLLVVAHLAHTPLAAQESGASGMAMPDPRQMSGIPLPVSDMPPGTVTVRVIRGSLSNALPNQDVELRGGGTSLKARTNDSGRAEFTGVAPGLRLRALATVADERLESQEFEVPEHGGVRLMLVASDPEAAARAAEDQRLAAGPAQPGLVVLGEQTRFVLELGDEGFSVFNILQMLNTARMPVQPAQPLVFDLPARAENVALLEGSSPQAAVAGRRVTVSGPFAPGTTLVQFAYSLPFAGDTLMLEQRLPVPLTRLSVLAQKVGDMQLSSPQLAGHRDMVAEGQIYIVAQGSSIAAGDVVTLTFTGLPYEAAWPRRVAFGAAALILAAGAWLSVRGPHGWAAAENRRRTLETRRERLFADLTVLEDQHLTGRIESSGYASRRRELVTALERVYAELDEQAA